MIWVKNALTIFATIYWHDSNLELRLHSCAHVVIQKTVCKHHFHLWSITPLTSQGPVRPQILPARCFFPNKGITWKSWKCWFLVLRVWWLQKIIKIWSLIHLAPGLLSPYDHVGSFKHRLPQKTYGWSASQKLGWIHFSCFIPSFWLAEFQITSLFIDRPNRFESQFLLVKSTMFDGLIPK